MPDKIPSLKKFKEVAKDCNGNVTLIARTFKVWRTTVYDWGKRNPDIQNVIDDHRGKFLDECLQVGRVVALGIPVKNEDGTLKGWAERPSENLLKYFISTLGRKEGYGEHIEADINVNPFMELMKAATAQNDETSDNDKPK